MARKKKQQNLKSLHEETTKALNKLKEELKTAQADEIVASRDIVLSFVKHGNGEMELAIRDFKKYSSVFLSLLLKGVYLALIIDNLPEEAKTKYSDELIEAQNNILSHMDVDLSKSALEGIEKFIGESV